MILTGFPDCFVLSQSSICAHKALCEYRVCILSINVHTWLWLIVLCAQKGTPQLYDTQLYCNHLCAPMVVTVNELRGIFCSHICVAIISLLCFKPWLYCYSVGRVNMLWFSHDHRNFLLIICFCVLIFKAHCIV